MSWTPESDQQDERPTVRMLTIPLPITVRAIADERTPEGCTALGTYFEDRLLARLAISPEAAERLPLPTLFAEPVALVAELAVQEDGGVMGWLSALVRPELLRALTDEPWSASVPSYDVAADQPAVFPLGMIRRFSASRKHPDDLAAEAKDLLAAILRGEGRDATNRAIDDLLAGL